MKNFCDIFRKIGENFFNKFVPLFYLVLVIVGQFFESMVFFHEYLTKNYFIVSLLSLFTTYVGYTLLKEAFEIIRKNRL